MELPYSRVKMPLIDTKGSLPGMGYIFCSCWLVRSCRPSKHYKLANTLSYHIDINNKTPLLKIPQT